MLWCYGGVARGFVVVAQLVVGSRVVVACVSLVLVGAWVMALVAARTASGVTPVVVTSHVAKSSLSSLSAGFVSCS